MPPKAPSSPPGGIESGGGRKKLSFLRRTTSKRSIRTRSARFLNPLKTAQAARDSVIANAEARHDPLFLDDPFAASVEEFEEMKAVVTSSDEVLGGGGGGPQLVSSMSERILIRGPRRGSRKLQNNKSPASGGGGGGGGGGLDGLHRKPLVEEGPHQPAASTSDGHPAPRTPSPSGNEMIGAFAVDGADPGYNQRDQPAGGGNGDSSGQGGNPPGGGMPQQTPAVAAATAGDSPMQQQPTAMANSAGVMQEPSAPADRAGSNPSTAAATAPTAATSSTDDGNGVSGGPAAASGSPAFNNEGIAANTAGDRDSSGRGRSAASTTSKEPGDGTGGTAQHATAATETSAGSQHKNGTSSESSQNSALPLSSQGGRRRQERGALRQTSSTTAQQQRTPTQTERRPRPSLLAAMSSTARLSLADEELPATSLSPPRANGKGSGSGNNNARPTLASECLSPSRSLRSQRLAARGAGYLTATSSQSLATSSAFVQASCQWHSETVAENNVDGKEVRQDQERQQQGQGQQSPLPPPAVSKGGGGLLGVVEEQKDEANKTVGTPVLDATDNVATARDDKTSEEEAGSLGWKEWLERKYRKKEEKQQQQQKAAMTVRATVTESATTTGDAGEGKDIRAAPKETHERADNPSNNDASITLQPLQGPPLSDAAPPVGVEMAPPREQASVTADVAKAEVSNEGRAPPVSDSSDKNNDNVNAKENKQNGLSTIDDFDLPVEKHSDGINQTTTKKTNRTKDRRKQFATAARCASESSMAFVSVRCKDGKVWDLSNLCKSPDQPAATGTGNDDCKGVASDTPTSKGRENKSVKQSKGRSGSILEDTIDEEEQDEDEAINAALASFAAFSHPTANLSATPQRRHTVASAHGSQRPPRGGQQQPEAAQRRATDASAAVDFSNLYPQITKVNDGDGMPLSGSSDDLPASQTEQQRKESAKVVVDKIFKMTESRTLSNESVGSETFDECDKKQAHRPIHDDRGKLSKGSLHSLKDDQADDSTNGGATTETVYVATCGHTTTMTAINNAKAATRINNSKVAAEATTSMMHPSDGETWMSQAEQRRMQNLRDLHAVQALLRGEDLDHYNDGPPPAPSPATASPARKAGEKVYASTCGGRGVEVESALPDEAAMKTMWMSSGIDAHPAQGPVAPLSTEAPSQGSTFPSSSPAMHERRGRGGGGYDNGASQLRSMLEEQRNIWGESSSNVTISTTHTRSEAVSLVGRTPNRRGHSVTFSDTASVAASSAVASYGGRGTADEGRDDRSRRFPLGTQLSLSSFETEENNNDDDANSVCSDGYERRIVEISPGQFMCLRGSAETWDAIQKGEAGTVKCIMCDSELKCVRDAELVICPDCRVLSPVPPDTPAMRDGSTAHDQFGMRGGMVDSGDSTELRRPCGRATHMNILGRIGGVGLGVKMNEMMRRDSGR